jgi:hypothetical protein
MHQRDFHGRAVFFGQEEGLLFPLPPDYTQDIGKWATLLLIQIYGEKFGINGIWYARCTEYEHG